MAIVSVVRSSDHLYTLSGIRTPTGPHENFLRVVTYKTSEEFLQHCGKWLSQTEDINNNIAATANLICEKSPVYSGSFWFASIEDRSGEIVGCGLHAYPDAINGIFESVRDSIGPPHRIMAPHRVSEGLALLWQKEDGLRPILRTRWHAYRVDTIVPPTRDIPGELRKGNEADEQIVRYWGKFYGEEKPAPVDVSDFMARKLSEGDLYIWDDGGPRTMIALSGRVGRGIRVSAVYTPPEHRGKGYASAGVAEICQRELDGSRDFVTLVAEIDDPAERMYQRLGFYEIGERSCFLLKDKNLD
jgi:GNAT superfamily N-acetyltransferase